MRILAIETSCDESAIAIVDIQQKKKNDIPRIKVIKHEVASQIKLHAQYGGVVPALAKREHIKNLPILLKKIIPENRLSLISTIDCIAVTVGPGLEPALWTGIEFAKELARKWKKPLIGANHIEGHLYSFLLSSSLTTTHLPLPTNIFPAIGLIVSGGHTIVLELSNLSKRKKLGETLDDAVGESFDKVARLLELPYPGGPALEKCARNGDPRSIPFPSPMIDAHNYNFSYSGLKTAVLYYMKGVQSEKNKHWWSPDSIHKHTGNSDTLVPRSSEDKKSAERTSSRVADIAASFQYAAFRVLAKKAVRAARACGARAITIGGGVAASKKLPEMIRAEIKKQKLETRVIAPPLVYCMDNAVMIALAGFFAQQQKKRYPLKANGILNIK